MKLRFSLTLICLCLVVGVAAEADSPRLYEVCPTKNWTVNCEQQVLNDIDPQGRELWIRSTRNLKVDATDTDTPLAIYVSAMAASNVYWNGELFGSNGVPGATPDQEVPGLMDWVAFLPRDLIREGENELIVHMSSQHNLTKVIQPLHVIGIGPYANARGLRILHYLPALLTAGGLLLASIYFGTAFGLDRRNLGALFLATLSFSVVGQLSAEMLRGLLDYTYVWHVPRLIAIAAFALGFAVSLVAYVTWRIERTWLWRVVASTLALGIVSIVLAPAYDMKAVFPILIGSLTSLCVILLKRHQSSQSNWIIAGAIALFVVLIFVRQDLFLDRDFYLAAFALAGILFIDELKTQKTLREERTKAQSRTKELEVELLRRQISPHFLMNTLNTLSAWVEQDPKKSIDIIETLAEEYRAIDRIAVRTLIPISEELNLCRTHLKLLSYRAEHTFELAVEGENNGVLIPPAILLTLIENAFSHNTYDKDTEIGVAIHSDTSTWKITVNSPLGRSKQNPTRTGIGRSYIESRLADAFSHETWSFEEQATESFWQSVIVIPNPHG